MGTIRNQKKRSGRSPGKSGKYLQAMGTSTVRNYVWLSNEVMRSAVQDAIMKKREFASNATIEVESSKRSSSPFNRQAPIPKPAPKPQA